jgi:hypothetical protein
MLLCETSSNNQHKAYICSPCRSDTSLGIQRNIKAARVYMFYSNCCRAALRRVFEQKRSGAGLERQIPSIVVPTLPRSAGLRRRRARRHDNNLKSEILEAFDLGLTIRVFHRHTYEAVCTHMPETSDKCQLVYDENHQHFALSFNAEVLVPFWEEAHNA